MYPRGKHGEIKVHRSSACVAKHIYTSLQTAVDNQCIGLFVLNETLNKVASPNNLVIFVSWLLDTIVDRGRSSHFE